MARRDADDDHEKEKSELVKVKFIITRRDDLDNHYKEKGEPAPKTVSALSSLKSWASSLVT